jgi:hypothetical protein
MVLNSVKKGMPQRPFTHGHPENDIRCVLQVLNGLRGFTGRTVIYKTKGRVAYFLPVLGSTMLNLSCQWIGPHLKFVHLAGSAFSSFHVEWCTGTDGGPYPPSFPARIRVIYPAIHPFGIEAHGIRHTQYHPFTVFQYAVLRIHCRC